MRRTLICLAALVAVGFFSALPAADLEQFATEAAAQQHCPNDTVVWLNSRGGS